MEQKLSHDRLLSECFLWLWNMHSETRYTCFHVANELRRQLGQTPKEHMIALSMAKAIGVVPGVYDLIWYWNGVLYCFDVKVGADRLSDSQKVFSSAIEAQGGKAYEIRSLIEFVRMVESVLANK